MNAYPQLPEDPTEFNYTVTVTASVDFCYDVEVRATCPDEARDKAESYASNATYSVGGYASSMFEADILDTYVEDVVSDDEGAFDME